MDDDVSEDITGQETALDESMTAWAAALPVSDESVETLLEQDYPDTSRKAVARGMVDPTRRVLEEADHPFPAFGSLLLALRGAVRERADLLRRLDIPEEVLARFEQGLIHPAWFPRASGISASRLVPPEGRWHAAIREARS
jgi:hypothetical protein